MSQNLDSFTKVGIDLEDIGFLQSINSTFFLEEWEDILKRVYKELPSTIQLKVDLIGFFDEKKATYILEVDFQNQKSSILEKYQKGNN